MGILEAWVGSAEQGGLTDKAGDPAWALQARRAAWSGGLGVSLAQRADQGTEDEDPPEGPRVPDSKARPLWSRLRWPPPDGEVTGPPGRSCPAPTLQASPLCGVWGGSGTALTWGVIRVATSILTGPVPPS